MEESGLTDKEFRDLIAFVSDWYDRLHCLTMLKVLFRDKLDYARLSQVTRTIDLLNDLITHGLLSSQNFGILCDTIRITEQFALQWKIKERLPSFPDVKEGTILTNFSFHRQKLMKFGMVLTPASVRQIDGMYNTPMMIYADGWHMIIDLENRLVIREGNMKDFNDMLKILDLPLPLNALSEGFGYGGSSYKLFTIEGFGYGGSSYKPFTIEDEKMEKICRKINKTWKKIGTLLGFAEEELNEIDRKEFFHNPSLEMLRRLKVKRNADDFTTIIDALESSKEQEIPAEILARGPDVLKVYLAALEEGESDFNLVRLMVMGQENVGKTCLINSLLGKKFNEEHIITEVLAVTRSFIDEADNNEWTQEEIYHKDEIKDKHKNALATQIAEDLQKKVLSSLEYTEAPSDDQKRKPQNDGERSQMNSSDKVGSSDDQKRKLGKQSQTNSSKIAGPSGVQKRKHSNDEASGNEPKQSKSKANTIGETSQATASPLPMEVDISQPPRIDDNVIEKLVVEVMKGKSVRDNSLRIWDYGGQLIYHSIQRFYMTPEGIFVIVFNIADDLDAYANVIDSSGNVHTYYMTNLEYLLYFIQSAYMCSKDDDRYTSHKIHFPVCIIVGTHRNSLSGSEEEIWKKVKDKFDKIRKAINNQVYKCHVYPEYFAVENKLSSSDENIIELKKVILEIKEKMNRLIPNKWLEFLIAIHELSEEDATLPLEQVKSVARKCGISDETIDYAITYLSDVGEIMYHPTEEALKDIVVTQPMKIYQYFRTVFTIKEPEQRAAKLNDDWKILGKGVLTKRLLKHLLEEFPIFQNDTDETMFNFFVDLMKKFGLICAKKKQNTLGTAYYAFSHLQPKHYSEDPKCDQGDDKVSIFHDFCGFLPDYLFKLVVIKFIEEFQVEIGYEPKLEYEHARLSIDDDHYVRIAVATINQLRMFKTTIVRRQEPNASCVLKPVPETCKKVLSLLQSVLEGFCSPARGIQYKMCIPCRCNKNIVSCDDFVISTERYSRLFRATKHAASSSEQTANQATDHAASSSKEVADQATDHAASSSKEVADQATGHAASSSQQIAIQGLTKTQFKFLKLDVSEWYDAKDCLPMLKVLFRDHMGNTSLSKITNTMELMNELVTCNHLNPNKIAILHDTISITKHFALQRKIQERLPSYPNVEEGIISKQFTHHRQKLMKCGMNLTKPDVTKISGFYETKYTDSWSMITDCENKMEIIDGDMKEFIDLLRSLKIYRALNALLY